jgi:hypothetical protein
MPTPHEALRDYGSAYEVSSLLAFSAVPIGK